MKRFGALAFILMTSWVAWAGVGTAAVGAAASTGSLPPVGGIPMVRATTPGASSLPVLSLNWSGYAATANTKFKYVHSEFLQPALKCTGTPDQWTSNWVGLDGFTSDTVEQDGTFAWCGGPSFTTPKYAAWYEFYPANTVVLYAVKPGDLIEDSVTYNAGQYNLTVSDLSSHKTGTDVGACTVGCQRNSAEWIIERPAECNDAGTKCEILALADFKTSTMSDNIAQAANGPATGINGFNNYSIDMVTPLKKGFTSLDTVGGVDPTTDSFTATWDRSGQPVPITLGPNAA